ncbi:sporulation protein YqfC [Alkalithermobacter thermoalcaliphilus JW-YL-7 = DSM 7308]|uniref:Sporulation protein YabP/YqfC n=1 Tax=Alkalithermobacter thermoalcaliphilus JW-YL-7 = DSM 7308 TaxID=1121328 RepID=A0A150FPY7_CLOPD|nr:Sporulation protein YabP/YqfC [[Clostridium] paradoxum JW-YL-7 = DSM 7308]SHK64886.1 sporulation protein YqfC [[Clostridium] paradoxum JW-YL-7 = DSM 7308]
MFDLPSDLEVTLPRVTTIGNKSIKIENYIAIIEYSDKMIKIQTKNNILKIHGDNLIIKYITEEDALIEGKIYSIEYWV